MTSPLVNTRADLDALAGTPAHADFMGYLRGGMTRKQDVAVYPDGYGMPGYSGEPVEPVWVEVEDLSTIEAFGFTKAELG